MGGGGFKSYKDYGDTGDILKKISESESEASKQQYDIWVNDYIESNLVTFNNRDTEAISRHIKTIKKALSSVIDGTVTTQFGGSIAKRTHIDGLSDVDTLVILNKSELSDKSPNEVLNYFHEILSEKFKKYPVTKGDTAVTINFSDSEVQLLPALKYKSGIKIPDGKQWSNIIQPSSFARGLTVLNQRLSGKMIPTIKIIKAIVSNFPERAQLNGYHVESLSAEIFSPLVKDKRIDTSITTRNLLSIFFKEAPKRIRVLMKDVTGQSKHLDEYLGRKDSINRRIAADALARISRKIELADSGNLKETWSELLTTE